MKASVTGLALALVLGVGSAGSAEKRELWIVLNGRSAPKGVKPVYVYDRVRPKGFAAYMTESQARSLLPPLVPMPRSDLVASSSSKPMVSAFVRLDTSSCTTQHRRIFEDVTWQLAIANRWRSDWCYGETRVTARDLMRLSRHPLIAGVFVQSRVGP